MDRDVAMTKARRRRGADSWKRGRYRSRASETHLSVGNARAHSSTFVDETSGESGRSSNLSIVLRGLARATSRRAMSLQPTWGQVEALYKSLVSTKESASWLRVLSCKRLSPNTVLRRSAGTTMRDRKLCEDPVHENKVNLSFLKINLFSRNCCQ